MTRVPHPIPYQGSKRLLASTILAFVPTGIDTLYEPFAGSAAVSLAAAARRVARRYHIGDSLQPLTVLWAEIVRAPQALAEAYRELWEQQRGKEAAFYLEVRDAFNRTHDPAMLLYLLARCVKNAVRFNQDGQFNQSPDHRRKGVRPEKMRDSLLRAHHLLAGKTTVTAADYAELTALATPRDLVYFDPPYMGVSNGRDRRYHEGLDYDRFLAELDRLNRRGVPFLLSFDGRCGTKVYGESLPAELGLRRVEIEVGQSAQATLSGRSELTVESLYLSPALGHAQVPAAIAVRQRQEQLAMAVGDETPPESRD